jgi:cobalt-zinc-cadmium efflux system protein
MEQLSVTAKNRRTLWVVFGLTFTYFLVEVVGGLVTNSLALLADAAHMLTDVGGLGLALFAAWMSSKPATPGRTYGYYRVEILAALANAVVLFLMSFFILFEAYRRFREPPEVSSLPMMAVAGVGFVVNVIGILMLRKASSESLNMKGAYLEVVGDLLGSVGVLIAGVVMLTTGWWYADPLFSVVIGLFILPRTWSLLSDAVGVLLEGTPAGIDLAAVRDAIGKVPGVVGVHDLHVWAITSGVNALSVHVVMTAGEDLGGILVRVREAVAGAFPISHVTVQAEPPGFVEQETHL